MIAKLKKQYLLDSLRFSITQQNSPKVLKRLEDYRATKENPEESYKQLLNFVSTGIKVFNLKF